jgi:hypothetical protein
MTIYYYYFLSVLGIERRASWLLHKCSNTQAMPTAPLLFRLFFR